MQRLCIELNNVENTNDYFTASEINILYSYISSDGMCLVFQIAIAISLCN